ncbi:MAG: glycoside hydrolase family 3 C-terminal domain-containing protein [Lachnospiraceae bacterium]|nr:glycoside hydrolase family 3 C-terminal domain-containing protein [Lachnospiraceae bacterium]
MGKHTEAALAMVSKMTLEEKAGLLSGLDVWHTKPVERLGLPSILVSDGPHGLRKQVNTQDNLGIGESVPATCFPTASLLACSFDPSLTEEVGRAIGAECRKEEVSILLGPGINIKRSPLCGRNFEYYSEDPMVAGRMGAGFIRGAQSLGVGTSLKHFAVNNQEKRRMMISAEVDERTLHEIYLKGFEIAVKESRPATVMCSYNKVNGIYASENRHLLTEILREQWGYEGTVISDWGAVHDRALGVAAGLDLEMPGSLGENDRCVIDAVRSGSLPEESVNRAAERVTELVLTLTEARKEVSETDLPDPADNHGVAVRAAQQSMVLLKNEGGILPLGKERIAVIGAFAKTPRYQGAGSSKVHALRVDTPLDAMQKAGLSVTYAEGYPLGTGASEGAQEALLQKAIRVASTCDKVVIFAGLPERCESEGIDRRNMKMPEEQNRLIREICKVSKQVAVVLMGGAPIEIPWAEYVQGILLAYLGGEGVGTAVASLLTGACNPSGKLAETWPRTAEDAPCAGDFPGDRCHVLYRESVYVGYRYYQSHPEKVRFPFGHGLSYTGFSYGAENLTKEAAFGDWIAARFTLQNTGTVSGSEISFVFAKHRNETVFGPELTLVGFAKTRLDPGETKTVEISVDTRDLGYYHTRIGAFYAEPGAYALLVGGSMEELVPLMTVELTSREIPQPDVPVEDFASLLGRPVPLPAGPAKRPFTAGNCLSDVQGVLTGRILASVIRRMAGDVEGKEEGQSDMIDATLMEMPFYALQTSSGGAISRGQLEGLIDLLNGHPCKGIGKLLRKK